MDAIPDGRDYPFRFEPRYRWAGLPFGVTPRTARVTVTRDRLSVRFGPWRVQTPLSNVVETHITGPYALLKTAGPAHLSLADRGLTMATNSQRGLCMLFEEPVSGIDWVGLVRHPGLTVTVADCEGLATALRR